MGHSVARARLCILPLDDGESQRPPLSAQCSASLLGDSGGIAQRPSAECDLNPDVTMVPAGGAVVRQPKPISGAGSVRWGPIQSDSGMTIANAQPNLTASQTGALTVT